MAAVMLAISAGSGSRRRHTVVHPGVRHSDSVGRDASHGRMPSADGAMSGRAREHDRRQVSLEQYKPDGEGHDTTEERHWTKCGGDREKMESAEGRD